MPSSARKGERQPATLEKPLTARRCRICIATIVLLLAACAAPPRVSIYRYVNVLGGTKLQLGEHFERFDLVSRVDDTTLILKPGTFGGGGTRQIWAYIDTEGVLHRLEFYYDGSEPFDIKVRDYLRSLGPATERTRSPAGAETIAWQDSLTRFALYLDPGRPTPMWSRLDDLTPR
jgi:hypothetical protein